jgi:hypothetical protein
MGRRRAQVPHKKEEARTKLDEALLYVHREGERPDMEGYVMYELLNDWLYDISGERYSNWSKGELIEDEDELQEGETLEQDYPRL